MRQASLFEPQTEHDLICAIEQRGWYLLEHSDGITTWYRGEIERVIGMDDLAAWLAAGTPDKAEASAYDVEQVIRQHGPITRRALAAALKTRYQVADLGALLAELLADGWIEETPAGYIGADRI